MILNDDQCKAILAEGLHYNYFEPSIPAEESDRLFDAERLVNACLLARKAGNKSDGVNSILFIAESDMKPEIDIVDGMEQTKISVEKNMHNGLNLAELSDGILDQLITGLDKYPQTDEVEADRKAYTAEKERRENASKSAGEEVEEDSSAQVSPENAENELSGSVGEGAGESGSNGDDSGELQGDNNEGPGGKGIPAQENETGTAQGEDAGAFARAQTPETGKQGSAAKAAPEEKDGERAELEAQLTYDMVKAHDIDLLSLSSAPISTLKFIIDNPTGSPAEIAPEENKDMPIDESEVVAIPNEKVNAVGGISAVEAESTVITKADVGIEVDESEQEPAPNSSGVDPERDKLESLVTGPMLKAWRKGRREVPSIGDNELRLMVLNPTAQVSPEELQKAQKLDYPGLVYPTLEDKLVSGSGPVIEVKVDEPVVKKEQAQEVPSDAQINVVKRKEELEQVNNETNDLVKQTDDDEAEFYNNDSGQNRALKIIQKENFPIPGELDERPPILPADVSKVSRDELFSYHARFHAAETRMNWILCQEEDKLGDIEKLRRNREAIVAASIPFIGEDGKRNTNEFRDSQVNADSEVLDLGDEEHEIYKVVLKLKVLQKNYCKDCERLSRQMSKYEREKSDGPN